MPIFYEVKELTVEEKLKRIFSDPILWIETFCLVVNKNGKTVPFKLFEQQRYFMENIDKYNIILKARQQGFSTLAVAYSLYLAVTKPNSNCLLMSYKLKNAKAMFSKLKQMYNHLPDAVKPNILSNNREEIAFDNGSSIMICTCGDTDNARGTSLIFAHLSEFAFYKDTAKKQLLAIEQALVPEGKVLIETTANGMNHFQELYAKAEHGENLYTPFFFNWYEGREQFEDEYKLFAKRYINLHGSLPDIDELDEAEQSLYRKGATIEQLAWRRLKINNSSEEEFNQEFPSDPTVAFVTSGSNIFNAQQVYERLNYIDEVITLRAPKDLPDSLKQWCDRGLTLYDIPKPHMRYYCGVDTAEGVEQDYSAIEIIDEDGKQVAEFRSNKIKPFTFAQVVNDIGLYYNKALLVVEKASAGHTVIDKLKNDFRYMNLYKYKEYDKRGNTVKRVGFVTDSKSKPLMINEFVELFETGRILINSKELLKEMKIFTFDGGRMSAPKGSHDDLCLAFAMALYGLKHGLFYI